MKASLLAYNVKELYKKLEIKIIKDEYTKGCPKWPTIQIWLLEILGINHVVYGRILFFICTWKGLQ
jgi:hypothetical protein